MTSSPDLPPTTDLQRNDLAGAVAWFRWHRERNLKVNPEVVALLLRLQDEDGPLLEALDQLSFDFPLCWVPLVEPTR